MKKTILTIAIVLGMTIGAFAQNGGLFGKGPERQSESYEYSTRSGGLMLPGSHGETSDQSGDEPAPLGSGIAVLVGLGAAYALKKRNEK
jgi:hypothetical protein